MHPELLKVLFEFASHIPSGSAFVEKIFQSEGVESLTRPLGVELYLGKLSKKLEAAGKIRVFAITDVISQSVLAPLHKTLFSLLRGLEQDGTFNQTKPLLQLSSK